VPLAALAGVLMVTAVRMNEWPAIRFMFSRRFKTGMITFVVTLLATITLDLTQAILIGGLLSAAVFINQVASLKVETMRVDAQRLRNRGVVLERACPHIQISYLSGPLFFASTSNFNEAFAALPDTHVLILSMRGVPMIDLSGIEALMSLHEAMHKKGQILMLTGVQVGAMHMLERSGADKLIGTENFFWGADQAILAAQERYDCPFCLQGVTIPPHSDILAEQIGVPVLKTS